jgi:hypothetical protein
MKTKQPSLPTMKSTKNKDKTKKKPAAPAGDTPESVGYQTGPHAQSSPSRDQWLRLYRAADAFRDLAPWEWMDDDRIFGVQCPETGQIYYCCVLGALKEVFALIAYEGAEGLEGYLKTLSGEITAGPLITEHQLCLAATFDDRSCQEPRDLAVIRDLGLKYRGRNAWPLFRHHMPGLFPWHLSAAQAGALATCLEQGVDVLSRYAGDRRLLTGPAMGRHLVRVLETSPDGETKWCDKTLVPAPLQHNAPNIPINEIGIARLRRSPKKHSGDWEIGYAYFPACIQEHREERPYMTRLLVIVDVQSRFILSMGLEAPDKHLPAFRDTLLSCLEEAQQWPQRFLVNHENAATLAAPIAKALGITLKRVDDLPVFNMIYEDMMESMHR